MKMTKLKVMRLTAFLSTAIVAGTSLIPQGQAFAAQIGTIEDGVYFRTAPNTDSRIIRMLKEDEKVTIVEKVNNYWYKVKDKNGDVGYVSSNSKYINVSQSSQQSSQTGTIVSGVNMRAGSSTDSRVIRMLKEDEKVTILDQVNSYWYKVRDKNGDVGYISTSSKYIKVSGSSSGGSSGGSSSGGSSGNQGSASARIEKVIALGYDFLGTPYEFGSNRNNTNTFDCSDFVRHIFKEAGGITLPSDSRKQGDWVKEHDTITTNWKNLKRGDLMFFMSYRGTGSDDYPRSNKLGQRITHVGIYLGDGKMLNTWSNDSGGVRVDTIDNKHWEYRFMFGGSVIK